MKKKLFILFLGLLIINLSGCRTVKRFIWFPAWMGNEPLAPYSGPKACIRVADFEVKASKATHEMGSGLRQMLASALVNSNRFSVQETSASPTCTGELIITAAITEFEPQASGGSSGVGGGGGVESGILGGLLGQPLNKAHIELEVRIASASTSKVLSSTRVQGQATDAGTASMGGASANKRLGQGLSVYANTPMEKAIYICIAEAARYIIKAVPGNYYKY